MVAIDGQLLTLSLTDALAPLDLLLRGRHFRLGREHRPRQPREPVKVRVVGLEERLHVLRVHHRGTSVSLGRLRWWTRRLLGCTYAEDAVGLGPALVGVLLAGVEQAVLVGHDLVVKLIIEGLSI